MHDGIEKHLPALQVWTEDTLSRPNRIIAVSLTQKGFVSAQALANERTQVLPWQLPKFIVKNRELAEHLTGKTERHPTAGKGA